MTKTLEDIPVGKVWQAQQAALMRLQLYATGQVHEIFIRCWREVGAALAKVANEDGSVDGLGLVKALQALERVWKETRDEWVDTLNALRWEAAGIPFGSLARLHNSQFSNFKFQTQESGGRKQEAGSKRPVAEADEKEGPTFVFEPPLKRVMDAADQRLYTDGLHLSQRIWNLDHEGLEGIKRELYAGVANGDSAWDIARRVEQYLGAGQDCPRWTRTRLYSLTKKDIASGDRAGLVSGDECAGQGVAYNALRMTRTEIQAIHHMATVETMQHMPWVTAEQIFLSPAHPAPDECDEVVEGGEKGDGVYPVGEIILPLHPNCAPPGQQVISTNGIRAIETIAIGDQVLTHEERYRRVVATMSRHFEGNLIRLTTASGKQVTLTPDHPVWVNGAWVAAGEVKKGDRVSVLR